MRSYAPTDYKCPICLGLQGIENEHTMLMKPDLIYRDELTSVFINSFFIKGNEGHLIVVPNEHFENISETPANYLHAIIDTAKEMSEIVLKAYGCDGIMLRQNNGPASGQHAFHFHMHIHPRYDNVEFNDALGQKRATTLEERLPYIEKLKVYTSTYVQ